MTWLLAQGDHLPVIIVATAVCYLIGRLMWARREEIEALRVQVEELAKSDDRHMKSVGEAHDRIDAFMQSVHADVVHLAEMAHDHQWHQDQVKEQIANGIHSLSSPSESPDSPPRGDNRDPDQQDQVADKCDRPDPRGV